MTPSKFDEMLAEHRRLEALRNMPVGVVMMMLMLPVSTTEENSVILPEGLGMQWLPGGGKESSERVNLMM